MSTLIPEYMNTADAATYLGMSEQWLNTGRCHGYGPPFIKLGHAVRYHRPTLDAWMLERQRQHTSEVA